jgi:hypothetical protein
VIGCTLGIRGHAGRLLDAVKAPPAPPWSPAHWWDAVLPVDKTQHVQQHPAILGVYS